MINIVRDTIYKFQMIEKGDRVLCALSGGADSTALLLALKDISEEMEFELCACHLNHGLRGEEADFDEEFSKNLCKKLEIPFVSEKVNVLETAKLLKIGTEECARNLRYEFFEKCLEKFSANKIATAHNANDVLETVIFNMSRGTGIRGLCGIPKVRENIIRPLINADRCEIIEYLGQKNQEFVTDKSNLTDDYTRNKIRNRIIPLLLDINEAVVKNTLRTCKNLENDADFLENFANTEFLRICTLEEDFCSVKASDLLNLHPAMSARVIFKMIEHLHNEMGEIKSTHVEEILAICKTRSVSAKVSLPNGILARREYDILYIEFENPLQIIEETEVFLGQSIELLNGKFILEIQEIKILEEIHKNLDTFYVSCDNIDYDTLHVRSRKLGDKIKLSNKSGTKTLKKLFIERKIPKIYRESIPVLSDKHGVIAVYGLGADVSRMAEENTIKIKFTLRKE